MCLSLFQIHKRNNMVLREQSVKKTSYLGNKKLKKSNIAIEWTPDRILEMVKCKQDAIYFIETYCKIIHVDRGLVNFNLHPFQKEMISAYSDNRFVICKMPRQVGKTTTTAGFILWRVLFNEHYSVAILANKDKKAREILDRIQKMFENLPQWMQQGVTEWNKGNIELENGSKIVATSTSSSAARGDTYNCVSGDANITIRVDGKVTICSIKQLEHMLANSSKYTRFINSESVEDLIDVSTKQIHQDIFQFNEKRLSWTVNRATPHHTEMYGRNESARQFDQSFYKSPSSCTQTFDQNGNRSRTQKENVLCLREDGERSSRKVFENKFGYTKTNTFGAIRTTKTKNDWTDTFCKNKRKDFKGSFGETAQTSFPTNEIIVIGTEKGGFEIRVSQREHFESSNWPKKEPRSYNENKSKSRENKENCRETQRYEEISGSKTQNEFGQKRQSSLEQRIEVLTEKGFKRFHGLRKTRSQKTIQLFVGEKQIVCTPEHKIMTTFGWISAQDCLGKSIITSCGNLICNKMQTHLDEDVYDILHVDDTNSFYANDILVHNCVYLDEFAHVERNIQEEFFASVYPTISSGETTQLVMTSTPKGMELFYKIWVESEEGRNSYKRVDVHWSQVPGRDEKWKQETIANTSEDLFRQEHECEFLGSSNTLIHPTKLRTMVHKTPIINSKIGLKEYHTPQKGVIYAVIVDTARGVGEDSSAFIVVNVNTFPYQICCTFKSNIISPLVYPNIIYETAKKYNDALILVETNDIGQQVADILHHDLEYEGVLVSSMSGRAGQSLSGGFATSTHRGIRTTKQVKRIGCSTLKTLVESDKFIIEDYETISELSRFSQKGNSYEAESGNDDLAMCCVLFGWLSVQPYFKEITDLDIRKRIYEQNEVMLEEEMLPFGFYSSGEDEVDMHINEMPTVLEKQTRDEFSSFLTEPRDLES